jgi:hypothetical protein
MEVIAMTNEENNKSQTLETGDTLAAMSALEFARLGDGHLAYIRQLDAGEAIRLFPQVEGIPEGIDLFALLSADGTPLTLRDSRDSALADAIQNDLEAVSIH